MPLDGNTAIAQMTACEKLRHLAEFMETLTLDQVDLKTVHHACGAAHCAWGWGEVIGLFPPAADSDEDDMVWAEEMESAKEGRSAILGLSDEQFRFCFGMGYQFRFLNRPYTPEDVARNLRDTAKALEAA
ncbi:MAG: hypothetical protein ACKVKG_06925 [Alphaproteobacteria bacterium]|jgi:hypothetical protein